MVTAFQALHDKAHAAASAAPASPIGAQIILPASNYARWAARRKALPLRTSIGYAREYVNVLRAAGELAHWRVQ